MLSKDASMLERAAHGLKVLWATFDAKGHLVLRANRSEPLRRRNSLKRRVHSWDSKGSLGISKRL